MHHLPRGVREFISLNIVNTISVLSLLMSCNVNHDKGRTTKKTEEKSASSSSNSLFSIFLSAKSKPLALDSDSKPIISATASKICSDISFINEKGDTEKGTRTCLSYSACTSDGQVDCITTSTYKALSMTNVTAGNIKTGVTIAGVSGAYPSSSYPLPSASGTTDLTSSGFNSATVSGSNFEFWDSSGTRHQASGDADIVTTNIANGVTIFGVSGNVTGGSAPDPWDIRVGVVVNGITGKLKMNCRNFVDSSIFNHDNIATLNNSGTTAGSALDIFDTTDNGGNRVAVPTGVVTGWSDYVCGGLESTSGDSNVWKDVTTTGDGSTASSCSATAAHCTYMDKITKLHWSKLLGNTDWASASAACVGSSHNGMSGWRLPTQKEISEAHVHGAATVATANWIPFGNTDDHFWSGTTYGLLGYQHYATTRMLGFGTGTDGQKTSSNRYFCVRGP